MRRDIIRVDFSNVTGRLYSKISFIGRLQMRIYLACKDTLSSQFLCS